MADPSIGWWRRQPDNVASGKPEARLQPDSRGTNVVLLLGLVSILVAVALLLFARGGAPSPPPSASSWGAAQGVALRSGYLARCEDDGQTASYCVCVFDYVTAQPAFNTPTAFAAFYDGRANDTAGVPSVAARALHACTTPAANPRVASRRSAV